MLQVWRNGTQIQRVFTMEEGKGGEEKSREENGTYSNTTKDTAKRETGMFHQGKDAGGRKDIEESRRRRGGAHGQATRCAARIEKKLSRRAKKESREAL